MTDQGKPATSSEVSEFIQHLDTKIAVAAIEAERLEGLRKKYNEIGLKLYREEQSRGEHPTSHPQEGVKYEIVQSAGGYLIIFANGEFVLEGWDVYEAAFKHLVEQRLEGTVNVIPTSDHGSVYLAHNHWGSTYDEAMALTDNTYRED